MKYTEFAQQATEAFKDVQERFTARFGVGHYDNWFYDQKTQLLTFSNDGDDTEINFKYIPIGTFSHKSNTWMWSWSNTTSVEREKYVAAELKKFGQKKGYQPLTEGHFAANKSTGWELLAIAHKVLGGVGGYRVKHEHLEIFMLVYEHLDQQTAQRIKSEKEGLIYCSQHGEQRGGFVCQHLFHGMPFGFVEAFPSRKGMRLAKDDDFQAWCTVCDLELEKAKDWTDEMLKFADIKLVCEECYFDIKKKYKK